MDSQKLVKTKLIAGEGNAPPEEVALPSFNGI